MRGIVRKLKSAGVLGLNARNGRYIMAHNRRALYPRVDDKIRCKQILEDAGLATPELLHQVRHQAQVGKMVKRLQSLSGFVLKPANGSGGDGITVITGRQGDAFLKADGHLLTSADLHHQLSCMLSGMYSLAGLPDRAMIEALVEFDAVFANITYVGVPDVRVIVYHGVPVMAMARLPTRASDGKANLHQGAIGVGITVASGVTVGGVWGNRRIDQHPDTQQTIADVQIPYWDRILEMSATCHTAVGLGYLGVDIVLDKTHGPQILELNARPGLNIQIANHDGLMRRLHQVDQHRQSDTTIQANLQLAKQLFH